MEKSESARELQKAALSQYENKIRPGLERLRKELSANSLHSAWKGFQRGATVSVAAGGALAFFTGFTGTPLLGAGAMMTIADVAVETYFARNRARAASPFTYLLDIEKKFAVPSMLADSKPPHARSRTCLSKPRLAHSRLRKGT